MARKLTRKGRVRRLDKVFSKYIRARDQRCVTCGSTEMLQCGHLFTRTNYSTRWFEANAFAQCAGCNLKHEHDPYLFTSFFLNNFGREAYDELHAKWARTDRMSDSDLDELYEYWKGELEKLEKRKTEKPPNYKPPTFEDPS